MLIKTKSLSFSYGDKEILKDINLTLNKGELISLLGPTGSGKSSLASILSLLEKNYEGEILFNKQTFNSKSKKKILNSSQKLISMTFQYANSQIFGRTVKEDILYSLKHNFKDADLDLALSNIVKEFNIDKNLLSRSPYTLSAGQKRLITIASAMITKPKLLILDEPTSNLDDTTIKEVIKSIKLISSKGTTVIVITHDINVAKAISKRMIYLDNKTIVYDGDTAKGIKKVFK
jgi:energy-coupling factor transporter ATP-binding protein EcfA2